MDFRRIRDIMKRQRKVFCFLRDKKGFTIIELAISLTLFAITVTLLSGILITVLRLETKGEATRETQQNARIMLEHVSRYTRQAKEVQWNAGTLTLDFKRGIEEKRMYFFLDDNNLITCVPFKPGIDPDPLSNPSLLSPINPDSVNVINFNIQTFPSIPGLVKIELRVEPDANVLGTSEFANDEIYVDTTVALRGQYN